MKAERWPLYFSVAYLTGKGLSFGGALLQPEVRAEGIYSIGMDVVATPNTAIVDRELGIIKEESLDHVYLGPRICLVEDWKGFLREATRKLKVGGHLVFHTVVGPTTKGQVEFYPSLVKEAVGEVGHWRVKGEEENSGQAVQIFKKLKGTKRVEEAGKGTGKKRVCVVRYGALGDGIIITPLLKSLDEDGWEVTLNCSRYALPVFKNNPHIHNIILQEREAIPNLELGEYWKFWEPRYEKYIQLSESIEGDLLKVEGRRNFYTTKASRQTDKNYYAYPFERAGMELREEPIGELFFSPSEEKEGRKFWEPLKNRFTILWALNGSSHHKVYPMMETVMREWLDSHSDSTLITVGDYLAKLLEIDDHPQAISKAGRWDIREAFMATREASLVIGPETAITNASGCYETPKIVLLSHSGKDNLTGYFKNNFSLEPSQEIAPCYPCFQLHYNKESCPISQMIDKGSDEVLCEVPLCCAAISGERLLSQIEKVYQLWKTKKEV